MDLEWLYSAVHHHHHPPTQTFLSNKTSKLKSDILIKIKNQKFSLKILFWIVTKSSPTLVLYIRSNMSYLIQRQSFQSLVLVFRELTCWDDGIITRNTNLQQHLEKVLKTGNFTLVCTSCFHLKIIHLCRFIARVDWNQNWNPIPCFNYCLQFPEFIKISSSENATS